MKKGFYSTLSAGGVYPTPPLFFCSRCQDDGFVRVYSVDAWGDMQDAPEICACQWVLPMELEDVA